MTAERVVVGAALLDGGRLLAARRSEPPELAGGWELPGGKVEPGEDEPSALVRECREELGVTVVPGRRVGGQWPLRPGLVLRAWTATVVDGVPAPLQDHSELRWLAPGEWHTVAWLAADRPAVAAVEALAVGPALPAPPGLLTVGHGALDRETLGALLAGAGVEVLVDVRRFPGSRRHPDVARAALERWLPAYGVDYRWEERLGGRRRSPAGDGPAPDGWWTVPAFAAYAAHTRTAEFADALAGLLGAARARTTAVMCSEAVWWRCHRRLVADVVSLGHGLPVGHLMPDGRVRPHRPAAGARAAGGGRLVWDAAPV